MDRLDKRLEELLTSAEPTLGDDEFSERVMRRLPRQRIGAAAAQHWTLAGAAAMGSLLTILLAPPVKSFFGLATLSGSEQTVVLTVGTCIAIVGLPLVWLYYASRR